MLPEEIRAEFRRLKTGVEDLKKFGITMAVILGLLTCLAGYEDSWAAPYLAVLAVAFLLFGIIKPSFLKHVYLGWMALALVMGFYVTKIIMALLFYGMFTPMGVIGRLFTKDMLDEQADPQAQTYWQPYPKKQDPRKHLERQF